MKFFCNLENSDVRVYIPLSTDKIEKEASHCSDVPFEKDDIGQVEA